MSEAANRSNKNALPTIPAVAVVHSHGSMPDVPPLLQLRTLETDNLETGNYTDQTLAIHEKLKGKLLSSNHNEKLVLSSEEYLAAKRLPYVLNNRLGLTVVLKSMKLNSGNAVPYEGTNIFEEGTNYHEDVQTHRFLIKIPKFDLLAWSNFRGLSRKLENTTHFLKSLPGSTDSDPPIYLYTYEDHLDWLSRKTTEFYDERRIGVFLEDIGNEGDSPVTIVKEVFFPPASRVKLLEPDELAEVLKEKINRGSSQSSGQNSESRLTRHLKLFENWQVPLNIQPFINDLQSLKDMTDSIPGQSQRNPRRPFTTNVVLEIATRLGETLYRIHSRDVIHNDLHPGNIHVRLDNSSAQVTEFKLFDFGSAGNMLNPRYVRNPKGGSGSYHDPMAETANQIQSDIFSYGMILYNIITLKQPFTPSHSTPNEQYPDLRKIQLDIMATNSDLHEKAPYLAFIIAKCTCLSVEYRFKSMSEVLQKIRQGLEALPCVEEFDGNKRIASLAAVNKSESLESPISYVQNEMQLRLISTDDADQALSEKGHFECYGDTSTVIDFYNAVINSLKSGDYWVAFTTPPFWLPQNLNIDGSFMAFNRMAINRGVRIARLFVLADSVFSRELDEDIKALAEIVSTFENKPICQPDSINQELKNAILACSSIRVKQLLDENDQEMAGEGFSEHIQTDAFATDSLFEKVKRMFLSLTTDVIPIAQTNGFNNLVSALNVHTRFSLDSIDNGPNSNVGYALKVIWLRDYEFSRLFRFRAPLSLIWKKVNGNYSAFSCHAVYAPGDRIIGVRLRKFDRDRDSGEAEFQSLWSNTLAKQVLEDVNDLRDLSTEDSHRKIREFLLRTRETSLVDGP